MPKHLILNDSELITAQAEPPAGGLWFSTGVYSDVGLYIQHNGTWRRAENGAFLPDAVRCHRVEADRGKRVLSRGRIKASKMYRHLAYL